MTERESALREFLAAAGWSRAHLSALPGDASTRRYVRAVLGERTAMLMDQPQGAESPPCPASATAELRHALGYNALARLAGADCARFVAVARYLRAQDLSAPEIFHADTARGFVLMEDLGDALYADAIAQGADEVELYRASVEALVRLHLQPAPVELGDGKALYAFDETALLAETDLLTEWFLPLALGRPATRDETEEHRSHWRDALSALPSSSVFVHRDYHAQNLLWLPRRRNVARVGVIDFQDAVAGAPAYDLVSLLEDARRDVAPELANGMIRHYRNVMAANGRPIDEESHGMELAVLAAQRNAKIAGIFARLFRRDGKPRYLAYLPRVWGYLSRDLEHPALAALRAWFDRTVPREARTSIPGSVA